MTEMNIAESGHRHGPIGGHHPAADHALRLPGTQSHIRHAARSGDAYRVDIAIPDGMAPAGGWPAIFLLDATGCFGSCVEALQRMSRRPDATAVYPAIIIGITAVGDKAEVLARRRRDFTTPRAGKAADDTASGGAADFLAFIEQDVKPFVSSLAPVDCARQTLFGHSLAGYFTLWVLLNHPAAFHGYAAISPSIWWDRPGLLGALPASPIADKHLLICVGEWEDALPPWQAVAEGHETARQRRAERQMIESARDIAERCAGPMGQAHVQFRLLEEEDHASIISAAIPRMLRLASISPDT